MQSQNSFEINFAPSAEVLELIGDTKSEITEDNVRRICPFKPCSKVDCNKFWHKPCTVNNPEMVRQLWPGVLLVGVMEILLGVILIGLVIVNREKYNKIYGGDTARVICFSTLVGLAILFICGVQLLTSLLLDMPKLMWLRITISTGLGGYIVILSVVRIHFGHLAIQKDPSLSVSHSFLLSDACLLEIYTIFGAALHFFGDVAVFSYYNLKFLHPTLFFTYTA